MNCEFVPQSYICGKNENTPQLHTEVYMRITKIEITNYKSIKEPDTVSDNMAIDSDGNMMMRMGDNMALDMDSGELHIISSWEDEDEDD